MLDIFDILGPVMIGPSSSHTAGAARIGSMARSLLGAPPVRAAIHLYGSFAETGAGHGTDRALVGGLLDMKPDDPRLPFAFDEAKKAGLTYTIDDSARNYTAIHLTIGYRRTQEQIASMVYTTSVSALGELLTAAARSGSPELVVQVGYFDHQEDQVRSIVDQVQAMEAPEQKEPWTVNFYPEGGDVGIIEILLKKS